MQPLKRTGRFGDQRGFSLMQMIVTAAIITTITTMAVLGLRSARAAMRLNNSARTFAQNLEKARLDAIRRHDRADVEFTSANTYEITMDFAGNGTRQTRAFTLDEGVSLTDLNGNVVTAEPYPSADFDWRGRTSECSTPFPFKSINNSSITVQVAGSGDISVSKVTTTTVPAVSYATVSTTSDIAPNTAITGSDTRLNVTPCSASIVSGGGSGGGTTVTATCATGTLSVNPNYITVRRNGGNTQTTVATVTAPGTLSFQAPSNLAVTASSSQTIAPSTGGSVTYTIRSLDKTRGTFPVKFNFSSCNPATVYVKVVN